MTVHHYCTYFDSNYLTRGLALYRSLARHAGEFRLHVLALDETTRGLLTAMRLPRVRVIPLADLERHDPDLAAVKNSRSRIEYYFTCTPSLSLHVMEHAADAEIVTYLDADLFLFADPEPVYRELDDQAILIVPHRFPPDLRHFEAAGIYNVGWLSFRKGTEGRTCLRWWRDRCLEWCYDRVEPGRFADQKYLDDWPARFPGTVVLQHRGAGLAPWNVGNYTLTESAGRVWVDDQPLILYHFHGLRWVKPWLVQSRLSEYRVSPDPILKWRVYAPYLRRLLRIERDLMARSGWPGPERASGGERNPLVLARPGVGDGPVTRLRATAQYWRALFHAVRTDQVWIILGDRLI